MPDWSYLPLFRPLLFRLPARRARALTLGAFGLLGRLPGGAFTIKTLGHMEPSPHLESSICGLPLPTPVGLSGCVDGAGTARRAMAQLGFGFMETGPVTVRPVGNGAPIELERNREGILYPDYFENEGADAAAARLADPGHRLPQFVRIAPLPGSTPGEAADQIGALVRQLTGAGAHGFYLDILQDECLSPADAARLAESVRRCAAREAAGKPSFLYVPCRMPDSRLEQLLRTADLRLWTGIVIGETRLADGTLRPGRDDKEACRSKLRLVRRYAPDGFILKAAVGVHEPGDALELQAAGADYLLLHSGMIYAGPGLPKRVNEALLHERLRHMPEPAPASFWSHWGWMLLLGAGMIAGGLLAWLIAATTVLLPYDEAFLGLTRRELEALSHRLLHFMSHDRVTLAGTMISIGVLYVQLARHGLRHGLHWARTALLVSCLVGFSSFFLYLGYGYFDPLHALAAALLLPMFILGMRNNPDAPPRHPVHLRNDRVWRLALWGQLCMIALGASLAVGGITIAAVGITGVFVPEDLAYLEATRDQIRALDPQLLPLIAHDRAGFGGALLADALALLIMALWGIQAGQRWIWRTFLIGGAPAFAAAFSVHWHIGYRDLWHLAPAFFALLLYILGLALLYPYLMGSSRKGASLPAPGPLSR